MSVFSVRPATLGDVKAIAEIHVASWQKAYQGILSEEHLQSLSVEKRQSFWREAVDFCEPQVMVACDATQVVGFVGFDRSRDKGSPSATGEIWAMYAHPSVWGQGAGLALWDAARDGLQEEDCTKVTLWVALRNERAMRFYDLAGFKRELPSAKTVDIGGTRVEEIRLQRPLV
jgi:ribosomal protein S18 acetylase RimI-like enzyme